jgi:scaffold protein (connect acetoacetyl-CoA thiolase and HMG-CoA synthase)
VAERGKKAGEVKIRPRIGRWEVGPNGEVGLIGSRCTVCGETFFPEHAVCARCGSEATEEIRLHGPARLGAFTVVHQVPAGFSGPLAVGYGRLEGDVLVLAPIDAPPDQLATGMPLDLHVGETWIDDDGEPMLSYRFQPAQA